MRRQQYINCGNWQHPFGFICVKKKYSQAKHCYEVARNVSIFMELPEEEMINLFGSREEPDKPIIGMFSEEEVQKAYQECIKRNLTTENRRYEPIKKVHG